jgi:hypothetical protein
VASRMSWGSSAVCHQLLPPFWQRYALPHLVAACRFKHLLSNGAKEPRARCADSLSTAAARLPAYSSPCRIMLRLSCGAGANSLVPLAMSR